MNIEFTLKRLLNLREGESRILKTRENSQVEFKQSFGLGSMPEYTRTMSAFSNTEGGFIVFGVKNSPHELIGVNSERFDSLDPAKITSFLNAHCSPELQWEIGTFEFADVMLGYIYTYPHFRKPVVITKNSGKELKEGDIYYRYRGQTTTIRFAELRNIIDALLDQERRGWLQHLSTISKAGAMNVAVLDTIQGKLFGAGAPFLIDEALLRQIKFIREGHFTESAGSPALRLVGEVRTVSGVTTAHVVQRGIHFDDLLTAFLASRSLTEDDAKSYLRESCHQMSPYTPLFYFARQAHFTREQAVEFIQETRCGVKGIWEKVIGRLQGTHKIPALSSIDKYDKSVKLLTTRDIMSKLSATKTLKVQRSIFCHALSSSPEIVQHALLPIYTKPLLESITHLDKKICTLHSEALKELLLGLFLNEFQKLGVNEQSLFRKAVAYLDEQQNG